MKIQNINPIYFQNYNSQRVTKPNQKQSGFKGSPAVQEAMKKFVPEAGFFMFNTPNLSKQGIEAFLRKFRPGINVRLLPLQEALTNNYQARAEIEMGLDLQLKPHAKKVTMALCLNNCNSFEDRVRLFEDVVHEMTHIYQVDTKSDIYPQNLTVNYFRDEVFKNPNLDAANEINNRIQNSVALYRDIEQEMHGTFARAGFVYENNIPKSIREANPFEIESAFFRLTGKTSNDYLRETVIKAMKKYNLQNYSFIEKLIRSHSDSEVEAHTIGLNAVKEIMGIKGDTDRDFTHMLYKKMSQFKF